MNTYAAKLTAAQVQAVRDLHRAGFMDASLARAFGITKRALWNIMHGRAWQSLPDVPAELPQLDYDAAARLRIRNRRKLTDSERERIEQYRAALTAQYDAEAEREGRAVPPLLDWTRRRPARAVAAPGDSVAGQIVVTPG